MFLKFLVLFFMIFSFMSCGKGDGNIASKVTLKSTKLSNNSLNINTGSSCSGSNTSCTPDNLEGVIYAGSAMWGDDDATAVTMIGATAAVI